MSNAAATAIPAQPQSGEGKAAASQTQAAPDFNAIKAKQKAAWMDGDYAKFATYMEPGAREILAGSNIRAGERLLDVACGAGQNVIPAAHAGIEATGIDIASNLVAYAQQRAEREGVVARFDDGDAEQLPYADGSFDVVISVVGAIFAPQPEKVAAELARVSRSGGRLCMVNWTPTGMVGQMFKQLAAHVPPPPGITSPMQWGDEGKVIERLGSYFRDIRLTRRIYPLWRFALPPSGVVNHFRTTYGPVKRAFEALDAGGQRSLHAALESVYSAHNAAADGSTELKAEYLDVQGVRR
jgi:SAM-dependent methyltransferase